MVDLDYLESDLHSCKLCNWRCGVDRLDGEIGVCGSTIPLVACSQLHPAPPASFDAFLTGCNFRCLFCQNWSISMFDQEDHDQNFNREIEGYYNPEHWAELALAYLSSLDARSIKADRLFFTGGEPTCSLPWVEAVVQAARQIIPETKVNYDTNGFLTKDSLKRVLEFTDSITYDLKAFHQGLFGAMTGANVKPVLRNLKHIIKNAFDLLWEVRVMVIPGVHEDDIEDMCAYLADLDNRVPLNFLAFRPNFIMEEYYGAGEKMLDHCVKVAKSVGLTNVSWSGIPNLDGSLPNKVKRFIKNNDSNISENIAIPMGFANSFGCKEVIRNCGACRQKLNCSIKKYKPRSIA